MNRLTLAIAGLFGRQVRFLVGLILFLPLFAGMFSYANQSGITKTVTDTLGLPDVSQTKVPVLDWLVAKAGDLTDARNDLVNRAVDTAWDASEPQLAGLKGKALDKARGELALKRLDSITTAGLSPKTGYDRDKFGSAWSDSARPSKFAGNGCSTRDDVLARDLTNVKKSGRCIVTAGTILDPYTAKTIHFTRGSGTSLDIDHLVALSWAWQHGASSWDDSKRASLANHQDNLQAVDYSANRQKGDAGPSAWLPPNKAFRCQYQSQFVKVVNDFDLRLTPAEKTFLRDGITRTCGL